MTIEREHLREVDDVVSLDLPWSDADAEETGTLVSRARAGDRDAYGALFRRFHDEIYRFAARRIGDPSAGQDVAADTFVTAFNSLSRFTWRGVPFEAWLYTIARRRIADLQRTRSRRRRTEGIETIEVHRDHGPVVVDAVDMRSMITRLPDAERDVIELRFMEDLDVEQTALRLGKRPGAVRVAQHRAIIRLRAMLAEDTG